MAKKGKKGTVETPLGGIENRQDDRVTVTEEVAVTFDDFRTFKTDYAENISVSGMYLRTKQPLPANSVLHFRLTIRDIKKVIAGKALVVWTKEVFDDAGKSSGMGLKFLTLEGDSENFIREFIEKHGPA